jgi:hypothetical protein
MSWKFVLLANNMFQVTDRALLLFAGVSACQSRVLNEVMYRHAWYAIASAKKSHEWPSLAVACALALNWCTSHWHQCMTSWFEKALSEWLNIMIRVWITLLKHVRINLSLKLYHLLIDAQDQNEKKSLIILMQFSSSLKCFIENDWQVYFVLHLPTNCLPSLKEKFPTNEKILTAFQFNHSWFPIWSRQGWLNAPSSFYLFADIHSSRIYGHIGVEWNNIKQELYD